MTHCCPIDGAELHLVSVCKYLLAHSFSTRNPAHRVNRFGFNLSDLEIAASLTAKCNVRETNFIHKNDYFVVFE